MWKRALLAAAFVLSTMLSPPVSADSGFGSTFAPESAGTRVQRNVKTTKTLWAASHWPETTGQAASLCSASTPIVCGYTVEAPGPFTAVRVRLGNAAAAPYQIGSMAITVSTYYGTSTNRGISSYGLTQAAQNVWLPVTFASGGQLTDDFPGALGPSLATSGNTSYGLTSQALSAVANTGATTLTFGGSNNLVNMSGATGMWATDGPAGGCIQPNTKVTGGSGNAPTISLATVAGILGTGCGAGAPIFFSYQRIDQFLSPVIPESPSPPKIQSYYSDWVMIPSLPRMDGPLFPGQGCTGTDIPAGDTIASVSPTGFSLANPTSTSQPTNTTIACATVATVAGGPGGAGVVANQSRVWLTSTQNIAVGQVVSGSASIPTNAIVGAVGSDAYGPWIELAGTTNPVSGALPTGTVATGTSLTFTTTTTSFGNQPAAGVFISVPSTTGNPLLQIRFTIAGSNTWTGFCPLNNTGDERAVGGAYRTLWAGTSGVQGLRNPGLIANNNTVTNPGCVPISGIEFLMQTPGEQWVVGGDSFPQGATSVDGAYSEVNWVANALSTPGHPIAVDNVSHGGQDGQTWGAEMIDAIWADKPRIVFMEGNTYNDGALPNDLPRLAAWVNMAHQGGAQVILTTSQPRQTVQLNTLPVNGAITAQTAIPMVGSANVFAGSGYGVTEYVPSNTTSKCTIPGGTTVAITLGGFTWTTSAAITCSPGAYLTLGTIGAGLTSGSTAVTLATPAPQTVGASSYVVKDTGGCVPANTFLAMTLNSTTAALSQNASGTCASDTLTLSTADTALASAFRIDSYIVGAGAQTNADAILDVRGAVFDPTQTPRAWSTPGLSLDGIHIDDAGRECLALGDVSAAAALNSTVGVGGPSRTPLANSVCPGGPTLLQLVQQMGSGT